MSVKLYMNLHSFLYWRIAVCTEIHSKICMGKCTPICKGTLAVVPLQFHQHFDIQIDLQKLIRLDVEPEILMDTYVKINKEYEKMSLSYGQVS
jgi:hypothetical protein